MKKGLTTIFVLLLCFSAVIAQPRRNYSSRRSGWDTFNRTLNTVHNVASTGALLAGVAHFDNYTSIRIGANAASLRLGGELADVVETSNTAGANVGIAFGWYLGKSAFILEPGVFLSMKGGELSPTSNWFDDYNSSKYRMTMLEFPVVVKYELGAGAVNFQPFLGGFMAVGIGGSTKFQGVSETYDTFSDEGFKSFDAGFRFGVGMNVRPFYFEIAADLGLVNLPAHDFSDYDYDNWDEKINSNCISLSVGIIF